MRNCNTRLLPLMLLCAALALLTSRQSGTGAERFQDNPSGTESPLSGLYGLVSVDGKALPADVRHGQQPIRIYHGVFRINADQTCESRITFGPPQGGTVVRVVTATFEESGGVLQMQWKRAGRTTGTIEGTTFRMTNEGLEYVYTRIDKQAARDVLRRYSGTWTGHPDDSAQDQRVTSLAVPICNGEFLQETRKAPSGMEQTTILQWDARGGCYRMWRFEASGNATEATGVWDAASSTMSWRFLQESGAAKTLRARHHFVDADTLNWSLQQTDEDGIVADQESITFTRAAMPR